MAHSLIRVAPLSELLLLQVIGGLYWRPHCRSPPGITNRLLDVVLRHVGISDPWRSAVIGKLWGRRKRRHGHKHEHRNGAENPAHVIPSLLTHTNRVSIL